jgi:hypothetical protein
VRERESCRRKKKGWERREERGERRENPTVYYLIIKGFQQCFPMHWETLKCRASVVVGFCDFFFPLNEGK